MGCEVCSSRTAAEAIGVCGPCLRDDPTSRLRTAARAHVRSQSPLPGRIPKARAGVVCSLCGNECRLAAGQKGFCGLRENRDGKLVHTAGTSRVGLAAYHRDPLPTNCVAGWVCESRRGMNNLAVFLGGCSFDCLFCQNRSHHSMLLRGRPLVPPERLAAAAGPDVACICFFGGDPSPQIAFALAAARTAREQARGRSLRICWETNGNLNPGFMRPVTAVTRESGGWIKFDLKAFDSRIHRALTGADNRVVLSNFRRLALPAGISQPPRLAASTLLVPGYVDEVEVGAIARFISDLNPDIPYSLLAFHPDHRMRDLPFTSREHAERCREAALAAGLNRVRIGNRHLLT